MERRKVESGKRKRRMNEVQRSARLLRALLCKDGLVPFHSPFTSPLPTCSLLFSPCAPRGSAAQDAQLRSLHDTNVHVAKNEVAPLT